MPRRTFRVPHAKVAKDAKETSRLAELSRSATGGKASFAVIKSKTRTILLLTARTRGGANLHANGAVIGPGFGQGAVAPAMRGMLDIGNVFGKGFVSQGRDVHFLGPDVSANVVWFHGK